MAKLGVGRRAEVAAWVASTACYTPGLTATTERSSDERAPERARDGASRAGRTA